MENSEFKMQWLENLFDVHKIKEILENCDKQCSECTKDEKNDCLLEMKECLYSLTQIVQDSILAFLEVLKLSNGERKEIMKEIEKSFYS